MPKKTSRRKLKPPSKRNLEVDSELFKEEDEEKENEDIQQSQNRKQTDVEGDTESDSNTPTAPKEKRLTRRQQLIKEKLIQTFDAEVENRCEQIRSEIERITELYRRTAAFWKSQLPDKVRNMKLSEFLEKYGGNATNVLTSEIQERTAALRASVPRKSAKLGSFTREDKLRQLQFLEEQLQKLKESLSVAAN